AVLVVKKIEEKFLVYPDVVREINASRHNKPVQINPHKGVCWLKCGSKPCCASSASSPARSSPLAAAA
ncbi:MAG: hypothetical protein II045_07855, partial [Oscillospiraceae bacterium]|nr:hypothetical protein [Oscillospiraceae bacterium]